MEMPSRPNISQYIINQNFMSYLKGPEEEHVMSFFAYFSGEDIFNYKTIPRK
jgi:hypothetical protein